mgnify:CR=1 FL=1
MILSASISAFAETAIPTLAVKVMAEKGIDISGHTSKTIDPDLLSRMDLVVTVCGHADERCPLIPSGVNKEHWPFDDPPQLAQGMTEAQALAVYRRVRDEIETAVLQFVNRQVSV